MLSNKLSLIGNKYNPNNIGLYRDDGLAVFKNTSGWQSEKIKKAFQKMFKNKGLDIFINCNMTIVNYLDVALNLNHGSYRPYKNFDVTIGSYDGAEVCELIGIFMLSLIRNKYNPSNIGLYRDGGLAVFRNTSGRQSEKVKKIFQKMFKNKGLDIIINCKMKIANYLDVALNLNDGSYRPCKSLMMKQVIYM